MSDLEKTKRTIDEGFERLNERQDSQDKWISGLEAKVNTAPSIRGSGHAKLGAIPDECRYMVQRRERAAPEIKERAGRVVFSDPVEGVLSDLYLNTLFRKEYDKLPGAPGLRGVTLNPTEVMPKLVEALGGYPRKAPWGEAGPTTGGSLVPVIIDQMIVRLILDASMVRPNVTVMQTDALTLNVPVQSAAFTGYIVPEGVVITAGNNTFSFCSLVARKYAGLAAISNEMLNDAVPGMVDYALSVVAEQIGIMQDNQVIQGDGTNVTGLQIVAGINSGTNSGAATSGGTVPTFSDLAKALYAAQYASTRKGAAWICHPGLAMSIVAMTDTNGSPIFQWPSLASPTSMALFGLPLIVSAVVSTRETTYTSSTSLYVGPLGRVIYNDVTGITIDIDPYSLFSSFSSQIRVLQRTGIGIPVGANFYRMRGCKYL